jgi:hypothetical protein
MVFIVPALFVVTIFYLLFLLLPSDYANVNLFLPISANVGFTLINILFFFIIKKWKKRELLLEPIFALWLSSLTLYVYDLSETGYAGYQSWNTNSFLGELFQIPLVLAGFLYGVFSLVYFMVMKRRRR